MNIEYNIIQYKNTNPIHSIQPSFPTSHAPRAQCSPTQKQIHDSQVGGCDEKSKEDGGGARTYCLR